MQMKFNKDDFADLHEGIIDINNQNLEDFKFKPQSSIRGMEKLKPERWEKIPDESKIEIEKKIRNQLLYVAEAKIVAINATKYDPEKFKGYKLSEPQKRYNRQVYSKKEAARKSFLVKLAQANELLDENEKHYVGLDYDLALTTLNMSLHFKSRRDIEETFKAVNDELGKEVYPTTVDELEEEFSYTIPQHSKNIGLISHQNRNHLVEYAKEFSSKTIKQFKGKDKMVHYVVDWDQVEYYINVLHPEFEDRQIYHMLSEINHIYEAQIIGKDRILHMQELLHEKEMRPAGSFHEDQVMYFEDLKEVLENDDEERVIKEVCEAYIKNRFFEEEKSEKDLMKEIKDILLEANYDKTKVEEEIQKYNNKNTPTANTNTSADNKNTPGANTSADNKNTPGTNPSVDNKNISDDDDAR